jgi:hypothetical protein
MRIPFVDFSTSPAILLAVLLSLALSHRSAVGAETFAKNQRFSTEHVVIKFKASAQTDVPANNSDARLERLSKKFNLPAGARLREPKWNRSRRAEASATVTNSANTGFMLLDLPPGLSVEDCLKRLKNHPDLEYAEADGIGSGGGEPAPVVPDDIDFLYQWHHTNALKPSASIHTPEAWSITTGSSDVVVAVLDSGVNTNLHKFSGRVVPGYNFVADNTDVTDDVGHGTVTATLLCANNDGSGGVGVDWNCKLMPIKVLDQNNMGTFSRFAQGINFAVANGAKVINLSAGGLGESSPLVDAINNAIAAGVIFVTITHNWGTNVIAFPGTVPGAITVGATDVHDLRCAFSDYGPEIALVAPGNDMSTTGRSGTLEMWEGTSCSAPLVSGVAALLCSVRPSMNQAQVRSLLCAGADDQVGDAMDTPGFDNYYGAGRLNAYNSLQLATTHVDVRQIQNGQITLSWDAPENASARKPFEIQFRALGGANWLTVGDTNSVTYANGRCSWTGEARTPGFFQAVIH